MKKKLNFEQRNSGHVLIFRKADYCTGIHVAAFVAITKFSAAITIKENRTERPNLFLMFKKASNQMCYRILELLK